MIATDYLHKIIRIRKNLIKNDKGHRNKMAVIADIDFIERQMAAYTYTSEQMQRFFARHSARIYNIIPGEGCPAHKKLVNEYLLILQNL